MWDKFIPSNYLPSAYDLDLTELQNQGIRSLFFDLDNTLTTYEFLVPPTPLQEFIEQLKDHGFEVFIVSNSNHYRVQPFLDALQIKGSGSCKKPFTSVIEKLLPKDRSTAMLIGDQLLTDILCANRLGIKSTLVNPLDTSTDHFFTRINRKIERRVAKKVKQHHPSRYEMIKARYE
jgi:uncharacterized protein